MMPWIIEPFLVSTILGLTYIVISVWREWYRHGESSRSD